MNHALADPRPGPRCSSCCSIRCGSRQGGWLKVWDYDHQLAQQKEATRKLEVRNGGLDAEVRDPQAGLQAIEERARFELGMIRRTRYSCRFRRRRGRGGEARCAAAGSGGEEAGAVRKGPRKTRSSKAAVAAFRFSVPCSIASSESACRRRLAIVRAIARISVLASFLCVRRSG